LGFDFFLLLTLVASIAFLYTMAPKQRKERSRSPVKKAEEAKKEEPKEEVKEEEKKFEEPDAPKDSRPALKEKISFETAGTTLNVVPTVGGKVLTCLADAGMANLIACARANGSQKAGRYMFEAKIIQVTDPSNGQQKGSNKLMRIGFSTSSSGLFLDDASSIYFDSEGFCTAGKKRTQLKNGRIAKDQVAAVVLNLDAKSPNNNTIALYRDGVAVGEPVPLPEGLQGKPLFPHLAFRSVSLRVNFGPDALKPLPFACRMLQGAAASDATVSPSTAPKDGKYEVMMPVAFPDEGTFEWLDGFLEKNPQYVELSDRKIVQWAQASGLFSKGNKNDPANSNDKPSFAFGVQGMDDRSVQKVVNSVAPLVPRNYVIMEVKSNLIAAERQAILKKFNYPCFKRVARVVMGEPSKEFKGIVQNKILKDKQSKSDQDHKRKQAEALRKKAQEKKAKEIAKQRKESEKKRKAILAEKKKKDDEAKKAKEGGDKKEGEEEKKDEPMEEKAESEEEPEEKEDVVTDPPVVELDDEEKSINFSTKALHDLTPKVMNTSFAKFTIPDMDDGFDDIKFEWQKESTAKEYLQKYILDKKLTTRLDDIRPGQAFKAKVAEFTKLSKEWQDKLKAFKAAGKKKAAKKDDEVVEDIDIFSVADVCDGGDGVPLFENFTFEDWELMKLRFEFCLLVLSFKNDCNDADRAGIPSNHFAFYFNRYYQKSVNPKAYGLADVNEVMGMIKDTISTKDSLIVSQLSDDLDNLDIFLKLTEENRRERQRRIDAGDETARLKFLPPVEPKVAVAAKPVAAKPAVAKPVAAKPGPKAEAPMLSALGAKPAPKAAAAKGWTPAWGKGKGK